ARNPDVKEAVLVRRDNALGVDLLRQHQHALEAALGDLHLVPSHAPGRGGVGPAAGDPQAPVLDDDVDLLTLHARDLEGHDECVGRLEDVDARHPGGRGLHRLGVAQELGHDLLHPAMQIEDRCGRAPADADHRGRVPRLRPAQRPPSALTWRVRRDLCRAAVLRCRMPWLTERSRIDTVLVSSRFAEVASFLASRPLSFFSCERSWLRRAVLTAWRFLVLRMSLTEDWMRATTSTSRVAQRSRRPSARSRSRATRASS